MLFWTPHACVASPVTTNSSAARKPGANKFPLLNCLDIPQHASLNLR
jgi:hypothetical protein